MRGVVLFWNRFGGWGFALPDDGGDDIFLHHSNLHLRRYLTKGDNIEYEKGERNGRPLALNICLVAPAVKGGDGNE